MLRGSTLLSYPVGSHLVMLKAMTSQQKTCGFAEPSVVQQLHYWNMTSGLLFKTSKSSPDAKPV
uniref:Uncharacterized protein n=1 Tax=Arundo donax TaxID=35708 RepID=A0A0A8XYA4_ARUDO